MPNIKSAKKRVKVSEANAERNKGYRSALKTAIKKADAAISENAPDAAEAVKVAVKKIDQAQNKGLLHNFIGAFLLLILLCFKCKIIYGLQFLQGTYPPDISSFLSSVK